MPFIPPFIFSLDFETGIAEASAPVDLTPIVVTQSYSSADVEDARAGGFADGYADGVAKSATAHAAQGSAALAQVAAQLNDANTQTCRIAEESAAAIACLLFAALGAAFPSLRSIYGEAELRNAVATILPSIQTEPTITIRAHPAHRAALQEQLSTMPPSRRAVVNVEAAEDVAVGDVHISWPDGAAIRDAAKAWTAVTAVLKSFGLADPGTPDTLNKAT